MKQYHDLLRQIISTGAEKGDRTGTGTLSLFGTQMEFDLFETFPLLATKFTPFNLIESELIWFLKGNKNIDFLHEHKNHIWDEWVKPDGTFGPIYGSQWRSWPNYTMKEEDGFSAMYSGGIDQIANVIERLKTNPDDRRMIVSAWNVADVESGEMALPPCHVMFQFYTRPLDLHDRYHWALNNLDDGLPFDNVTHGSLSDVGVPVRGLSCQLYQRSADMFLGVPFNIASYALLVNMIAYLVDMVPDRFIWTGGDTHIYLNHLDQVHELLRRDPKDYPLPQLIMRGHKDIHTIDDFNVGNFMLSGYEHGPSIKAPVAV